ncbi:PREDICTED: RNA polymerase-associated protein RTF1 homolog [Amphimedon queenslandica]|uniref:Plus3 domain-containing protein n=1 Tax=Amphimedon queenslandica TaxID=400682 RepID=A0A1X7VAY6_AMPQE|nr:PREDICTED: RNA polymerase-associated protein RTF1 homolog [Amphimedon queenslandica]|eukprot:XP_019849879.1 PREDICTED: RNA polymerase-associated protein RTF1 homolog [Amphimedon queenslandica]
MSKAIKRPLQDDNDSSDTESSVKRGRLSSSGSSSEESDLDWIESGGKEKKNNKKLLTKRKRISKATASSADSEEDSDESGSSGESSEGGGSDGEEDVSSSDEEQMTFNDGLDDDLIGDDEDRRKLASMTEAEREQEIFKRHEQREILKARFEVEMQLRLGKKQEKKMKKSSKKHGQSRSGLRAKEPKQNKTMRAIDELKAKRNADKQKKAAAAEADQKKQEQQQLRREPLKVNEVFSETSGESEGSSSSGEEESDDDTKEDKTLAQLRSEKNRPINTIEELSKIKMSRFRLEKWVHMPFFADVIRGCYVRIGIGQHEGRMIYRVCEIVSVHETSKVYTLGGTKTNKGLKLRFGQQERIFRMEYISNSAFTDQEFSKWKAENEAHSIKLPTLFEVEKKVKEIEKYKSASLKEEDIDRIIQEKQKFQKNPHNYALTKNRLMREKEIAEQTGSTEKATDLARKLEELEERAEELDKQRTRGLSAISYINERNRQRNVARAEEALKEEMANIKDKEEDPFTRRKCMPRLVTFGKEAGISGVDATDGSASASVSKSNGSNQTPDVVVSAVDVDSLPPPPPLPLSLAAPAPTDLFSAHNFDINIDLPNNTTGPVVKASSKTISTVIKTDGPKRSLNLSDYKKRRGLI